MVESGVEEEEGREVEDVGLRVRMGTMKYGLGIRQCAFNSVEGKARV